MDQRLRRRMVITEGEATFPGEKEALEGREKNARGSTSPSQKQQNLSQNPNRGGFQKVRSIKPDGALTAGLTVKKTLVKDEKKESRRNGVQGRDGKNLGGRMGVVPPNLNR